MKKNLNFIIYNVSFQFSLFSLFFCLLALLGILKFQTNGLCIQKLLIYVNLYKLKLFVLLFKNIFVWC